MTDPPSPTSTDGTQPATTTAATGAPATTAPAEDGTILAPAPGGATALRAFADCVGTPPQARVELSWQPGGAGDQRIDVTIYRDGFTTGSYDSSGTLDSETSRFDWDRAQGEASHHWRVLTRTPEGWLPSDVGTFQGPGCVGVDQSD